MCGFCVPDQTRIVSVAIIGDRAGRPDRGVHLVGPDIGALHRLCRRRQSRASTLPLSISVRGVEGLARSAFSSCSRSGSVGDCLPAHLELRSAALIAFSSRSATTPTKSPIRTTATRPGISRTETFIDRNQAGADKGAGIDAGIGRAHHAAMQHAGHAHIVHVDEFAGRLGRQIDARHRLADDAVGADRLHRNVVGKFEADGRRRRSVRHS